MSQTTLSTAGSLTIVLVHGAFADASSWTGVIERLQKEGVQVIALANPLRGLASDSAYIASVFNQIPGPVLAVGHSYGGALISNAATKASNVVGLVYVAAFAPDEGERLGEVESGSKDSVTSIPDGASGPDGTYSHNLDPATIQSYIDFCQRNNIILFLDLDICLSPVMQDINFFLPYLEQYSFVHMAIDPEWMFPRHDGIPGVNLSNVRASNLNPIIETLAQASYEISYATQNAADPSISSRWGWPEKSVRCWTSRNCREARPAL